MKNIQPNISIFEKGDKRNQSILFVHGFPYDHHMWDRTIEALSGTYHCVSYDIRGLGESDTGDGQYTIEMFVDDLMNVMDKTELEEPVLASLSMGGYISLRAVERHPGKFKALVLCDTKSAADDNEGKIKRSNAVRTINEKGLESFIQEFVPACFAEDSPGKLGAEYDRLFKRSLGYNPLGIKGCLLAMAGRTDTTGSLTAIDMPVLLICGEKDKLTPPPVMREMSSKIRGSRMVVVPGSGHMTPVEDPGLVIREMKNFLGGITS